MTTTMALDALREAAERLEKDRPDLGVHVVPSGPRRSQVSIEVTRQPRLRCDRCGQSLPCDRPGPVAWIDERTGDRQGTYDWQHGCGEWNSPIAARVELHLADEHDWDTLLTDLASEVDRAVREEHASIDAATRTRLRDKLRDALVRLAAGEDPDEVEGNGLDPGVYRDDAGRWIAWDMDADGVDPIIVTEDDLR